MSMKTALIGGIAVVGAAALVLGVPAAALAGQAYYYNGNTSNSTWHSSYDRSQKNCIDAGSAVKVQVKSVGVTTSGTGPICMSYALQNTWEYCRVTAPTSSVPIDCYVDVA